MTGEEPPIYNLIEWVRRWIDVNDARYNESDLFQNVIHNVLPPGVTHGGYELCVDFGSAGTEALDELIEILSQSAKAIVVKSRSE